MSGKDRDRFSELEELFSDLWQVPRFAAGLRHGFRPQIDCFRTEEPAQLTVIVEIPGIDPERVQIVASGRRLRIAGDRPRPRCEGQTYFRSEIEYGPFVREIELAEDVDADGAEARYDRGLLRIDFPLTSRPPTGVKVPIDVRRHSE